MRTSRGQNYANTLTYSNPINVSDFRDSLHNQFLRIFLTELLSIDSMKDATLSELTLLSYLIIVNFGAPPHYFCLYKGHQKVHEIVTK